MGIEDSDNIPFRTTDGIPEIFQRMFVDSTIAQHMTMSRTKVSYMMGNGLGPHFLQMTVDDILSSPIHTTQFILMKPQL